MSSKLNVKFTVIPQNYVYTFYFEAYFFIFSVIFWALITSEMKSLRVPFRNITDVCHLIPSNYMCIRFTVSTLKPRILIVRPQKSLNLFFV